MVASELPYNLNSNRNNSVAQMSYAQVYDESDWNEKSSLTRNPYYYSKTLAEKAAWDFMDKENPVFSLVVINPFAVLGYVCQGLNPSVLKIAILLVRFWQLEIFLVPDFFKKESK
jgi:nucleoside-diphosphate-sugar epimerase